MYFFTVSNGAPPTVETKYDIPFINYTTSLVRLVTAADIESAPSQPYIPMAEAMGTTAIWIGIEARTFHATKRC